MRLTLLVLRPWQTLLAVCLLAAAAPAADQGRVIYVNHAATGANNGATWADAFLHPSQALAVAARGDEIWVAQGVYLTSLTNAPAETFLIRSAVRFYGGFDGTETHASQRDPLAHPTTLSGELQPGNAEHVVTVDDASGGRARIEGFEIRGGSAPEDGGGMTVVSGEISLADCRFVSNHADRHGGALFVGPPESRPIVRRCSFTFNTCGARAGAIHVSGWLRIEDSVFEDNEAQLTASWGSAGAVYVLGRLWMQGGRFLRNRSRGVGALYLAGNGIYYAWDSLLRDVTFESNSAYASTNGAMWASGHCRIEDCRFLKNSAAGWGGAVGLNGYYSTYRFQDCIFEDNVASGNGGAIFMRRNDGLSGSSLTIDRCVFARNRAGSGGALHFQAWRLLLTNSLFVDNVAVLQQAGAFFVAAPSSAESLVMNCTVVGNQTSQDADGAAYLEVNAAHPFNPTRIVNSIFWGNEGPGGSMTEWDQLSASARRISYCCIQNHQSPRGDHITASDPLFVNPLGGDFHLSGASPLVDAASPNSGRIMPRHHVRDLDGQSRIRGPRVDVGADEVH